MAWSAGASLDSASEPKIETAHTLRCFRETGKGSLAFPRPGGIGTDSFTLALYVYLTKQKRVQPTSRSGWYNVHNASLSFQVHTKAARPLMRAI